MEMDRGNGDAASCYDLRDGSIDLMRSLLRDVGCVAL